MGEFKTFGSNINNENKYEEYFEHMKIKKGDEVFFLKECDVEIFYTEKQLENNAGEFETVSKDTRAVVVRDRGENVDLRILEDCSIIHQISKLSLKRIK